METAHSPKRALESLMFGSQLKLQKNSKKEERKKKKKRINSKDISGNIVTGIPNSRVTIWFIAKMYGSNSPVALKLL